MSPNSNDVEVFPGALSFMIGWEELTDSGWLIVQHNYFQARGSDHNCEEIVGKGKGV